MTLQVANDSASVGYYEQLARTLVPAYNSISFEQANPGIGGYLPPLPALVLDVGAGSGRDARALAAKGHRVLAVEPSPAFRLLAARDGERLEWMDDRLPELSLVLATGQRFDFILCSAVLMLLSAANLGLSFKALARLLAPRGRLAITLRAPAAGEPPHIFHSHSDGAVVDAALAAGLEVLHCATPSDALGRSTIAWRSFVFGLSGEVA